MLIHQSDLAAWSRCPAQYGYKRAGSRQDTNSAAAFGSVMHYALHWFERHVADLKQRLDLKSPEYAAEYGKLVDRAVSTFVHYWSPINIESICEPVPPDGWIKGHNFNELRVRGAETVRKYAELVRWDDHEALALEYSFVVPIEGTDHLLAGTVDRLAVRHYLRQPAVCVDDWKTGKEHFYLRHNLQFTAYLYATTRTEFWTGFHGEEGFGEERGMELYERLFSAGRRGTWISLRSFKYVDAGWRGPKDYERFTLAAMQLAASVEEDIYPLTLTGEACKYCPFRATCGGIGVLDGDYGKPGTYEPVRY